MMDKLLALINSLPELTIKNQEKNNFQVFLFREKINLFEEETASLHAKLVAAPPEYRFSADGCSKLSVYATQWVLLIKEIKSFKAYLKICWEEANHDHFDGGDKIIPLTCMLLPSDKSLLNKTALKLQTAFDFYSDSDESAYIKSILNVVEGKIASPQFEGFEESEEKKLKKAIFRATLPNKLFNLDKEVSQLSLVATHNMDDLLKDHFMVWDFLTTLKCEQPPLRKWETLREKFFQHKEELEKSYLDLYCAACPFFGVEAPGIMMRFSRSIPRLPALPFFSKRMEITVIASAVSPEPVEVKEAVGKSLE